jgi:uncharacterized iron-regulated membrane protein
VRDNDSRRLTWLDLHNLLGIVTVLWVFVVGATGVINTLAKPLISYWQSTELAEMTRPWLGNPAPSVLHSLQRTVETAQVAAPGWPLRFVAFPGTAFAGTRHYAVFLHGPTSLTSRLAKVALIDAETGALTGVRDMPWYGIALGISRPLHFGDYGGLPLKLIWALLDLITIVVLLSGLYLWWKKRGMSIEHLLAETDHRSVSADAPASVGGAR